MARSRERKRIWPVLLYPVTEDVGAIKQTFCTLNLIGAANRCAFPECKVEPKDRDGTHRWRPDWFPRHNFELVFIHLCFPDQTGNQRQEQQAEKNKEQDLSNTSRCTGNSAEAEHTGDEGYDQKDNCII